MTAGSAASSPRLIASALLPETFGTKDVDLSDTIV
jgi:hypothetical protein